MPWVSGPFIYTTTIRDHGRERYLRRAGVFRTRGMYSTRTGGGKGKGFWETLAARSSDVPMWADE